MDIIKTITAPKIDLVMPQIYNCGCFKASLDWRHGGLKKYFNDLRSLLGGDASKVVLGTTSTSRYEGRGEDASTAAEMVALAGKMDNWNGAHGGIMHWGSVSEGCNNSGDNLYTASYCQSGRRGEGYTALHSRWNA